MEWVDMNIGKPQMIQGMHTYPSPSTSTQTTKMDLHSGSKDLIVPFLMFMRTLHGTFLSSGKPLGWPPDSYLAGEVSHSATPNLDPRGIGVREDQLQCWEAWDSSRARGIFSLHHYHPLSFPNIRCGGKIMGGSTFQHTYLALEMSYKRLAA